MDKVLSFEAEKLLGYLLCIISKRMDACKPVDTPDGFYAFIYTSPSTFMFDREDLSVIEALPCSDMADIAHLVEVIESCVKGGCNG